MSKFKVVVFRTTRDYQIPVTCLNDVERAIGMSWPDKAADSYLKAVGLVEQAKAGWCTPRVAFEAFVAAAREQQRLVERRAMRDLIAHELSFLGA